MNDTQQTALALLDSTPAIFRLMLANLPDDILTADLDRGWSIKRVLAHMVDVEEPGFRDRLRHIIDANHPSITSYDAMATLEAGDYMSRSVATLLDQLDASRRETIVWLRTLTPEQRARSATHDTAGDFTIDNLLHYWPMHDMAHIRGVQRMLNALLRHEASGLDEQWDI